MNKLALISILLLGVGILSSSAVPTLPLGSRASGLPLAGVNGGVVVPVVSVVRTVLTNPGEIVSTGDALPSSGQINNTITEALETPGGVLDAAGHLVAPDQIAADVANLFAFAGALADGNATLEDIQEGVQLGSGKYANKAGALSLPTYSLCGLKLQYDLSSCVICNQDCYVAHNLWGGKCGASPLTGGPTCLCGKNQTDADARGIAPKSEKTCQNVYNPIGSIFDLIFGFAFRARSIVEQCIQNSDGSFNSNGCRIDCHNNHGYDGGVCQYQYPNVDSIFYSSQKKQLFCICTSNGTSSDEQILSTTGPSQPIATTVPTPVVSDPTTEAPTTTAASNSSDSSTSSTTSAYNYE